MAPLFTLPPSCILQSPTGDKPWYLCQSKFDTIYIKTSTWGNQRGEVPLCIKQISGAVAGDSRSYKRLVPTTAKFLAPLPGTPVYKIGELHTIFYLCFLVLLVYLSVF